MTRTRTTDARVARAPRHDSGAARGVGYVVSRWPAYSHAFITTEIEALTELGWTVDVFSVNRPDFADARSHGRAAVLKAQPLAVWARLIVRAVSRHPLALAGAAATAVRSGLARPRRAKGALWGLAHLAEALFVAEAARDRGIRHLHAHFANSGADVARLAVELGRRSGRGPFSWSMTVHGPSDFDLAAEQDLAGKVAAARDVVCISDYASAALAELVPSAAAARVSMIRMGVRLPAEEPRRDRRTGVVRLLFVGRIVEEKAPLQLLEAVDRLARGVSEHDPRIELTFVGAGPLLEELRRRAATVTAATVRCVGALRHEEVLPLYTEHDVLCLPSFSEGLPVVLMEAMAAGIAVVSTPVAAIPELVHDGETGLLVPPGDVVALQGALARLVADAVLRARCARDGSAAARRLHDVRASAAALGRLFA